MGNDAKLFCLDCNVTEGIGRAYPYNKEKMNQELSKEILTQLKLAKARIEMSLQKIELFGDEYSFDWFEEIIAFLEQHKKHKVYLIDDYFKEEEREFLKENNNGGEL